jgi:hypothetical protein
MAKISRAAMSGTTEQVEFLWMPEAEYIAGSSFWDDESVFYGKMESNCIFLM